MTQVGFEIDITIILIQLKQYFLSGGPLQSRVNGKLIGVVSFGLGCAKISHSGVYARVDSVRDWIRLCTGV